MNRTGLAAEFARITPNMGGIKTLSRKIGGAHITDVRVSADAQKAIGKPAGRYITIEGGASDNIVAAILKRAVEQLIPARGRILAAGLGNPEITRDALGAFTVRELETRRGARYSLAAIETDVSVKTGIETSRMVRAVAREYRADCVIIIDSLACARPERIGRTVQITDAGIIPGGGASQNRKELSRRTLGIDAVAVGVPTVTELSSVSGKACHDGFLCAPANEDRIVKAWADVIASALNSIIK